MTLFFLQGHGPELKKMYFANVKCPWVWKQHGIITPFYSWIHIKCTTFFFFLFLRFRPSSLVFMVKFQFKRSCVGEDSYCLFRLLALNRILKSSRQPCFHWREGRDFCPGILQNVSHGCLCRHASTGGNQRKEYNNPCDTGEIHVCDETLHPADLVKYTPAYCFQVNTQPAFCSTPQWPTVH